MAKWRPPRAYFFFFFFKIPKCYYIHSWSSPVSVVTSVISVRLPESVNNTPPVSVSLSWHIRDYHTGSPSPLLKTRLSRSNIMKSPWGAGTPPSAWLDFSSGGLIYIIRKISYYTTEDTSRSQEECEKQKENITIRIYSPTSSHVVLVFYSLDVFSPSFQIAVIYLSYSL